MRRLFATLVAAAVLHMPSIAGAQTPAAPGPPTLVIPRIAAAPRIEPFLTMHPAESDTAGMARVENFTQRWPDDGKPERFKTVAYLGYTAEAIHAIFLAFDPDPASLRAHLVRREEVFRVNDDEVEMRIDTYGDRRQSYYLVANPLGVQLDAAWPEVGGQYDESFDLVWHSRGQRTGDGFVVHMTVPFRSLRFNPDSAQPWGIYLGRWIPRTGEWSFWPPISIRQQSYLAQMARLDGIRDVERGRGIQLIPYGSSRAYRALDQRDRSRPVFARELADPNVGLDAKFILRDALVADATINPDFSQVESDAPQITANQRFEVFFPEKRPFFLENAGFLQTPINLMFTRRIADPQYGGKLSGRAGPWSIGALVTDDEAPGKRVAATDPFHARRAWNAAVRVGRNAFGQSNIGAIATHRDLPGRTNTVAGIDTRLRFARVWTGDAQVALSRVDAPTGRTNGSAYFVALARNARTVSARTQFDGRSAGFATDLGFVPRLDVHQLTQTISYTMRPAKTVNSWGPSLLVERAWAHRGTPLDLRARPGLSFDLRRSTNFAIFAEASSVTLRPGDGANVSAPITLRPDTWAITSSTSPRPQWSAAFDITAGSAVNFNPAGSQAPALGDYVRTRVSLSVRPLTPLRIENTWLRAALGTGGAEAFASNIVRSQWAWQFTREWSLRFIGQYESVTTDPAKSALAPRRNLNADLLLTRLVNPWTALYIGYNGNGQNLELVEDGATSRLRRTTTLQRDAWQIFVKWSHLLRW
ncbi:MAG TPA: DUF5916 domain-containing protein [Vicinamibacterales bacterium]|nr:DUF5916 domain-containing protein [Vicinamibacterales bacterium]